MTVVVKLAHSTPLNWTGRAHQAMEKVVCWDEKEHPKKS
jgi:hypothetical protein